MTKTPPDALPASKEAEAPVYKIEHDGFCGTPIGSYVTREGKRGVVLQQVGTKVVHVYGEKWLPAHPPTDAGVSEAVADLCPRCAGTGRDPSTTSLQCHKCMGCGAIVIRAIPAGGGVPLAPEVKRGNFIAVTTDEPQINNWHTAIYEDDYKGLLIAMCNQNGRYPWQVRAILAGLNAKNEAADALSTASTAGKG